MAGKRTQVADAERGAPARRTPDPSPLSPLMRPHRQQQKHKHMDVVGKGRRPFDGPVGARLARRSPLATAAQASFKLKSDRCNHSSVLLLLLQNDGVRQAKPRGGFNIGAPDVSGAQPGEEYLGTPLPPLPAALAAATAPSRGPDRQRGLCQIAAENAQTPIAQTQTT
ncbi:unnamed protein product [Lampetra fluviatilis]